LVCLLSLCLEKPLTGREDESSYLGKLFRMTVGKTPEEIADYLEEDEELEDTHESAAQAGQSEVSYSWVIDLC
jgi:hypothetical protein